jgi:succinate dehydrogenase / fumarate reductase cytochrome b subunit
VYKFGAAPVDADGHKDLYQIVISSFEVWWYAVFYVVAVIVLGFHLIHGIKSAFRTLGVYHEKFILWLKYLGYIFSILITIGFAIIPIIIYFKQL